MVNFEKNFGGDIEKSRVEGTEEFSPGNSLSREEREAAEKALEKVVDLENPENKNLYFHQAGLSPGGDKAQNFLGGIFNTESILRYGLVGNPTALRAGIKRSRFGDSPDRESYNKISTFYFRSLGHHLTEGEEKRWGAWGMGFVFRLDRAPSYSEGFGDFVIHDTKRIKPDNIIGLKIEDEYIGKNIADYFETELRQRISGSEDGPTHYFFRKLYDQLEISLQNLNLSVPEKTKEQAELFFKTMDDFENTAEEIRDLNKESKALRVVGDYPPSLWLDKQRRIEKRSLMLQKKLREQVGPTFMELFKILMSQERFRNIKTFGDYMKMLGTEFKMPIYTETNGLFYPKAMSHQELADSLKSRE